MCLIEGVRRRNNITSQPCPVRVFILRRPPQRQLNHMRPRNLPLAGECKTSEDTSYEALTITAMANEPAGAKLPQALNHAGISRFQAVQLQLATPPGAIARSPDHHPAWSASNPAANIITMDEWGLRDCDCDCV